MTTEVKNRINNAVTGVVSGVGSTYVFLTTMYGDLQAHVENDSIHFEKGQKEYVMYHTKDGSVHTNMNKESKFKYVTQGELELILKELERINEKLEDLKLTK